MPFSPDPYAALRSAARYVRQFRRKTFVVLLDGPVLGDAKLRRAACEQIALLWTFSIQPVVVHGAGPELDSPYDAGLRTSCAWTCWRTCRPRACPAWA